jgi:hypothetical protein
VVHVRVQQRNGAQLASQPLLTLLRRRRRRRRRVRLLQIERQPMQQGFVGVVEYDPTVQSLWSATTTTTRMSTAVLVALVRVVAVSLIAAVDVAVVVVVEDAAHADRHVK